MRKTNFLLVLIVALPAKVFAWGAVGHRTIAHVAESKLTPTARAAVGQLLGRESLADVANWADSLREEETYQQTKWYHYEKIPDGVSYIDNLKKMPDWQKKKGGIVAAILVGNEVLRDTSAPKNKRQDALKFLVHFVGDIHQPMHSGRPDDKGGVTIDVDWFGEPSSLHRIWDSGMMRSGHPEFFANGARYEQVSVAYAKYLAKNQSAVSVAASDDPEVWLRESLAVRAGAYNTDYRTSQRRYMAAHLPEVDQRLYVAGVRLANMLNSVYAGQTVSLEQLDLRSHIEAVLGDIHSIVSLEP